MNTRRKALLVACFAAPVAGGAAAGTAGIPATRARTIKARNVDITLTGWDTATQESIRSDGYDGIVTGAPAIATQYSADVARHGKVTNSKATLHGDDWIFELRLRH